MRSYSPFFQTLHDEHSPTPNLGRGTHHSVLRAVVFHDAEGKNLKKARDHDFAVIWDEDHDERVIDTIDVIYRAGLLPSFIMFGERKGFFSAVADDDCHSATRLAFLEREVDAFAQNNPSGDSWPGHAVRLSSSENAIIQDGYDRAQLYLKNIKMLWSLGSKDPRLSSSPNEPHVVVHGFKAFDAVTGQMVLAPAKRESEDIDRIGKVIEGTAEVVPLSEIDDNGRYRPKS